MAENKKYIYRENVAKKIVYIDETVSPSPSDIGRLAAYLQAGYKTHLKSQKKVAQGKKLATKNGLGKKKEA